MHGSEEEVEGDLGMRSVLSNLITPAFMRHLPLAAIETNTRGSFLMAPEPLSAVGRITGAVMTFVQNSLSEEKVSSGAEEGSLPEPALAVPPMPEPPGRSEAVEQLLAVQSREWLTAADLTILLNISMTSARSLIGHLKSVKARYVGRRVRRSDVEEYMSQHRTSQGDRQRRPLASPARRKPTTSQLSSEELKRKAGF
jgi:hypothetical protein